jgi:hypothetical protein
LTFAAGLGWSGLAEKTQVVKEILFGEIWGHHSGEKEGKDNCKSNPKYNNKDGPSS